MHLSRFHLATVKEVPADAEIVSHRLMLRAGMIRKLAAGIYTWSPLGLRVLRRVETIVREEMNRAGAVELLMPSIQPQELWEETGRWEKFGGQLLKIKDRKEAGFCYGPTHEEVITDFARHELKSYKQLPVNFYQIQTKFRDEIRPRFGIMRAREFLMKDAYSFHVDGECLQREYRNMYDAYARIFTRLGLRFRAVDADTGAIGGSASHEFQVLAESGEDAVVFSDGSDYAANIEKAEALAPSGDRPAPSADKAKVSTPWQRTCEEVSKLLEIPIERTVKTVALCVDDESDPQFVVALVRGDHMVNEIKLARLPGMAGYRLADEDEINALFHTEAGFLGPVGLEREVNTNGKVLEPVDSTNSITRPIKRRVCVIADRSVALMADMVVGANEKGFHLTGVNWGRDLPEADLIADIRNAVEGDASPDGQGTLSIARGIEVGHVFQLGQKYAEALGATVLDDQGKARVLSMGCYGIGVSRIVAAAIEQNHDDAGIIWPEAMAPWQVVICPINFAQSEPVREEAERIYTELSARGIEVAIDDRGLRPGPMFADMELIGIPHRIVIGDRGLATGTYEYRRRGESENRSLTRSELFALFV